MATCLQFQELQNIDYDFYQTTSLEQTFGSWGRCGNSYLTIDINGVSYTELNVVRALQEASNILGISTSSAIGLKAPQGYSDMTGVVSLNNSPTVRWGGQSMMIALSYLNIYNEQEYGVFTYSFIDGSLNLIEKANGEFKTFENIDGSRNIVELLSGLK